MPSVGQIELEKYHTIYFFVVDMKPFLPERFQSYVGHEFIFSLLNKEDTIRNIEKDKKNIKKYVRRKINGY
jgi:hypothetical protein